MLFNAAPSMLRLTVSISANLFFRPCGGNFSPGPQASKKNPDAELKMADLKDMYVQLI
jgi:hypothetical protein